MANPVLADRLMSNPVVAYLTRAEDQNERVRALRRFATTQTLLTIVGHLFLGFEQAYIDPIVAVLSACMPAVLLETIKSWRTGEPAAWQSWGWQRFLLPSYIVGMTTSMFLYPGERIAPVIFAASLAVCSKYVLLLPSRTFPKGHHFLNPSNFAILMVLWWYSSVGLMIPWGFSSQIPNHFDPLLPVALFALGAFVNIRLTKRFLTVVGWLVAFVVQAVVRGVAFDDVSLIGTLGIATGPIAMLFTFFMLPDPGTCPQKPLHQLLFGASVGVLYGFLTHFGLTYSLFWALVLTCTSKGIIEAVAFWTSQRDHAGVDGGSETRPASSYTKVA